MATSRDQPLTEIERARALARFRCLVGRAIRIEVVPLGPIVDAATPAQLDEAYVRWCEHKRPEEADS